MIQENSRDGESEQPWAPLGIIYVHVQKMVTASEKIHRKINKKVESSPFHDLRVHKEVEGFYVRVAFEYICSMCQKRYCPN